MADYQEFLRLPVKRISLVIAKYFIPVKTAPFDKMLEFIPEKEPQWHFPVI